MSDEEWTFVAPYLLLCPEDAGQRVHAVHAVREVFNALRWLVRAGAPWRLLPTNFPPWAAVYQQTQRWLAAGCFEALVHDLRVLLRWTAGRDADPTAVILDGRTLQSTPESGGRAGYDGHKRRRGSKVHLAVDTLGHLLALHVTPASEQERAQVDALAQHLQDLTDGTSELAYVDQGYTGRATPARTPRRPPPPTASAWRSSRPLRPSAASCCSRAGVALVVERSFAWTARFRRLARDYERLTTSLAGFHFIAFAFLLAQRALPLLTHGS